MPTMIKGKIDLAKIHGAKVVKKNGHTWLNITDAKLFEGKNGAIYLDLAMFPTPDDKFGNDYRISQDVPKELRDAGAKGQILGNAKNREFGGGGGNAQAPAKPASAPAAPEDVPF